MSKKCKQPAVICACCGNDLLNRSTDSLLLTSTTFKRCTALRGEVQAASRPLLVIIDSCGIGVNRKGGGQKCTRCFCNLQDFCSCTSHICTCTCLQDLSFYQRVGNARLKKSCECVLFRILLILSSLYLLHFL